MYLSNIKIINFDRKINTTGIWQIISTNQSLKICPILLEMSLVVKIAKIESCQVVTGKSLLEALILASTNPQHDKRMFIDLPVQCMKTTSSERVVYINCFFVFVLTFKTIYVHKMF